ncbi:MAG: PAS domain-containing protein [Betaproteobacteria bacterium]|nr:PAS domain-containing protein [Betaproteobacteria bacterium]
MNTRLHLLLIIAGALLGAALLLLARFGPFSAAALTQDLWPWLALVSTALIAIHIRLRIRLSQASESAKRTLLELDQPVPGGGLMALAQALHALSEKLSENRNQLSHETRRREQAEDLLRESEERYALAVRGADDGMWEWNLRTDSVYFSPRWKSMLGYADHELGDRMEEWRARVHPQDVDRVVGELDAHLQGKTVRFENEHRLLHRDGRYRWILARGAALRNAAGRAYRMVGLHTDISARKQVQEALLEVADGLSTLSGDECFRELTKRFAEVLGVREAFVCECSNYPATRVRMLARWNLGGFANCVEFDLTGTACEDVIQQGKQVFVPGNVAARWPLEKTFDRESYLGLPCIDTQGRVIGHIACADGKEMRQELPHLAILKIFAIRAAVELERRILERERLSFPKALHPENTSAVLH